MPIKYDRKAINDFFRAEYLDQHDRLLFEADVDYAVQEQGIPDGPMADRLFRAVVRALANAGWMERRPVDFPSSIRLPVKGGDGGQRHEQRQDRLLRPREAADLLGMTLSRFQKLAAQGRIPYVPVCGEARRGGRFQHKMYRREDLHRWLEETVVEAKP